MKNIYDTSLLVAYYDHDVEGWLTKYVHDYLTESVGGIRQRLAWQAQWRHAVHANVFSSCKLSKLS